MNISVIVCTYNRCHSLKDTLESLVHQESGIGIDYEVIIVDNNSKDKTKKVVESYTRVFNGRFRYIFEPNQGLSYARNRGIKEAKGEVIAFTDDDVILDRKWLLNIWECFQADDCDAVGGRIFPLYVKEAPQWIKDNADLINGPIVMHDYGDNVQVYNRNKMLPFVGANVAFKKKCFSECGLFRTDIGLGVGATGEDTELFRRLGKNSKKLYYCGKAIVWHKVSKKRTSLRYIAKWFTLSGRYFVRRENGRITKDLIYYFDIPRYIYRELIEDAVLLLFYLFNKRKFLEHWRNIFINIGKCLEYKGL